MRYKLTLSYDGSSFCGWQIQPNATTVQGTIESALATLLRAPVGIVGAGRTDTLVNASHYVAHFDWPAEPLDCPMACHRLNGILPKSISIESIEPVSEDFHARFSATRRDYTYHLHIGKDPFALRYSCFYPHALDFEAMNKAAQYLLGTHDFACFEKTGADSKTSICTVFEAAWAEEHPLEAAPGVKHYVFHIAADRFLRNMVRAIVGTLLEVGRGKRAPESMEALLASQSRCAAGESVPGHALFLSKIEY